ncbi:hypothetical protein CEXT_531311 [Caerostris extrusa]|uniref:Uncharacterized protein n=1 Tax=Caerostris extrusa TaxID=172846 RepID=A0AAV4TCU2_CAEEX|nr:hypothetical protein CEXT_531311 [Caerostris extrusa]
MLMNFPEITIFPPPAPNSVRQTMITHQERDRIFCLRTFSWRQCHSSGCVFSIVQFSGEQLFPSSLYSPLGELRRAFSEWKIKT